jgi:2-polyprenyl-6-methoxyphenol hydroxylase-like FAD-dependent oxidoreductase
VILIIGAGIGGLATALALRKAGAEVTVFEAHPDSGQDLGAFLTLASNGVHALAQIDAAETLAGAGFPLTTMRVLAGSGDEIATTALGDPQAPYRCLRRAELCAVLRDEALRQGIPIEHGRRFESLSEDPTGVTATFTDGTTARGDLLIGADGLNSAVRPWIDPAQRRYAGQHVFYGYTTEADPPHGPHRIDMIRGSTAAFGYAVSPERETYWFARVPGDELTTDQINGKEDWRAQLVPLLRADETPAADIVEATTDLMVTNAYDLPNVTRWRTPRTLLIGDAAHAASPATGQGASMALEDAVVLAKALRDAPTRDEALNTYERLRRPRVELNIATSARLTAARPGTITNTRPSPDTLRPPAPSTTSPADPPLTGASETTTSPSATGSPLATGGAASTGSPSVTAGSATAASPTSAPPTSAPPTSASPTSASPTSASPTSGPPLTGMPAATASPSAAAGPAATAGGSGTDGRPARPGVPDGELMAQLEWGGSYFN